MSVIKVTGDDISVQTDAILELKNYFAARRDREGRVFTYDLHTYGCQLNESDSEKISGMLEQMGLVPASAGQPADIVLMNTCAVRENAEDRLFGNLGEFKSAKRANRDMIIAVCGCMMKVKENVDRIIKSFPYVDLVFDPQQLHRFPELLRDSLRSRKQMVNIGSEDYIVEDQLLPVNRKRKFRALVPIMYGCNNFCTYCIVPYARGRERSRDFGSIIDELKQLEQQGYKEIMLLGQNVNSYCGEGGDGFDVGEKHFADILRAASQMSGFSRVRFMSSHPKDLSDEVIEIMAAGGNIETHLHLPVQSGSDRILKLMNRPYNVEQYMRIVELFRSKVPDGSISTDIIVGFPGETEEDFLSTLDVVRRARFDSAFTFQFSPRPGTKAAGFEGRLSHEVMADRFSRLLEIQNDLTYKSNLSKVGKVEEVLIEGSSNTAPDILTGRTRSNHLINFTIPEALKVPGKSAPDYEGELCMVRFTSGRPYSVDGIMESFCK